MPKTLVELVAAFSQEADKYHSTRSLYSISSAMQSEMGEVAEEVMIANGDTYKTSGPDGVAGEAIDLIVSALDLLYVNGDRSLTDEQLMAIASPKLHKWLDKIKQANTEGKIK